MQTVQQAQHVIVLLRQNEKLAKEVAQLKRLNQEQQQQIQSLISANRELIWAFNESRREHEELMKQLKTLMATDKTSLSTSSITTTNQTNGNVKQIGLKNEEESSTKQLISEFDQQKKRTKDEELSIIKEELNNLKSSPDSSKFLGIRRPAFFTPREYGDWHSVISGDLRKQIVLKIFQALCPEVTQKCIDDYNKAYPSRVDYIKKSIDFSFDTENELFVSASSKDVYLGSIAEKFLH
ncbi:KIX domain-containing protein [Meloidogyne graminicola]|uniref:KIX domain-containing protein n=1 Tax=Meloidogyne graminicola TaxID=189291 RepID=A0A8S9ZM43_9BILA|nr:KIX domain-containing protein [Meloidogyne graminicola]